MKALFVLFIISISLLMFQSCKSKSNGNTEDFKVSYKLGKGRSMVKPSYTIELNNTKILYNGLDNMDVMGERQFTISKDQLSEIVKAFKDSNFSNFEPEYRGKYRDLPMSIITYDGHEVSFQERAAPENLIGLTDLIRNLVPEE